MTDAETGREAVPAPTGDERVAAVPADTVQPPPPPPPAPTERIEPVAPREPATRVQAVTDPAVEAAQPAAPAQTPVETPAAVDAPPPKHGNRLVATLWVLFAALLFEAGYILLIAALVALVDGPTEVGVEMTGFFRTPYITWVPVLLFFVLYELTVLILGRTGRFAYVVASLIVGLLVWILSAQLLGYFQLHALAPAAALTRTLESPEFVLIGVLAREVMLWTGYAVGARGRRVRRANRRARDEYEERRRATARG